MANFSKVPFQLENSNRIFGERFYSIFVLTFGCRTILYHIDHNNWIVFICNRFRIGFGTRSTTLEFGFDWERKWNIFNGRTNQNQIPTRWHHQVSFGSNRVSISNPRNFSNLIYLRVK